MKTQVSLRSWRIFTVFMVIVIAFIGAPQLTPPPAAADNLPPPHTVFVHLFEWKWSDIARECETFLGPKGFSAVQVSPPNEHALVGGNPWWQRYQPVSYQVISRSGNRAEFADMVARCKTAGVDIYVDAIVNHMTGVGSGVGIAGSTFSAYSYPGIYGYNDFHHCGRNNGTDDIWNYQDRWEVQNCELVNLADLNTGSEYVRNKIAAYMNDMMSLGVAGFRLDASKHIDTNNIQAILSRVNGSPYIFQEVIDQGGEPITAGEYFQNGDVTEFKYSVNLSNVFYSGQLASLSQFGTTWGFMSSDKAVVFVDNHDNQRGHGGGGHIITYKDGTLYDLTNVFMLAWPYGYPKIMSSYAFDNSDQGPPSDANGNTKNVYNPDGTMNCFGSEWKCEHRWQPMTNMVLFRNVTASNFYVTNWWDNGNNQIAFGRGDKGFVVINKESYALNRTFQTSMPAGTYCNVIKGELLADGSGCTGSTITINADGTAAISVNSWDATAIHAGAKVNGGGGYAKNYDQVYLRGTTNNWGTTAMSLVADNTWRVQATFSGAANDRFKLDIYGDWSLNFGDTNQDGIADQGGSDIYITNGAGSYIITFNDQTKAYSVVSGGGGDTVAVSFNENATTVWGQNMYIVGNVAALGNWNTAQAVLLSAASYPVWSGTVNLPANTSIEYKYIKKDSSGNVVWESGANRVFTTPGSGTVTRNDSWK